MAETTTTTNIDPTSGRDITYGDSQAVASPTTMSADASNVAGTNVMNMASQLVGDPAAFFSNDMKLANNTPTLDKNTAGAAVDETKAVYQMDPGALTKAASTVQNISTVDTVEPKGTATYTAAQTQGAVKDAAMTAATGTVRPEAVINAPTVDMKGMATGTNADGTTNYTGQALNTYASQNISTIIDTSTVSGKLLAQTLGEGNYLDSKATIKGQLEILSKEFTDAQGNPKIPTWAAAQARSVSRIAAIKGMTGTAQTAAIASALMEASLPIATEEAKFLQTVTVKNLDNKQQQVINTANVLSKMELANMDVKLQAAVENSKIFMQMDLTNLSNEQQAAVVNTQSRVQSILEDAKAVNTERLFTAENTNGMNKFYDQLNSTIKQFNSEQVNSLSKFNSGEINDNNQFYTTVENSREEFYKTMAYNIDVANAKWFQTVATTNTENLFNAYATDIKNYVAASSEARNQLWDRSDSILDYMWKTSENKKQLDFNVAKLKAEIQLKQDQIAAEADGAIWKAVGTVAGAAVGSFMGPVGTAAGKSLFPV